SSCSTNRACRAPRESASKPIAPVPAKRSRTLAPAIAKSSIACSSLLKIASRTRSAVGRVRPPRGAGRLLPLRLPPMIRMTRGAPFELAAELLAQDTVRHLFERSPRHISEDKRSVGGADQPIDLQPQMLTHPFNLAVFTLSKREVEPD